jgi:hypothetical protein
VESVSSVVSANRVDVSVGGGGGVAVCAALTGAKCLNRSQQRSRTVTLKEIVVGVTAVETKCMFVSCGRNAVPDHSTKIGNKSVDSVAPSK